ncbi:TMF family protein [Spirosoma litoris]
MKQLASLLMATGLLISCISTAWSQAPTDQNVFLGYKAGYSNTTGIGNSVIGYQAGYNNTTASNNLFIGNLSGYSNTSGSGNAFIGYQAGLTNTTGYNNAFIGYQAGLANTAGYNNAFIGSGAGQANTSGANNSFIGYQAGFSNTTGLDNLFIGTYSGYTNTSGSDNAFIGHAAGSYNTTGTGNSFFSTYAGYSNTTGTGNTFTGVRSGQNNTIGNANTFVGGAAGFNNTSGIGNTTLGQNAGYYNTTGSNNLFIGYGAGVNAAATVVNNAAAIGANAIVTQSNSIVLGGTGSNVVNVGIGNTAPGNKLEITHGTAGNSGLRFSNLTSATTPIGSTNQFLTVNSVGDVVLAQVGGSKGSFRTAAEADSASLWSRDGVHLRNTNSQGGVVIGPGVANTPAGYRLYVADGVLTEKVKVAVKSSADWSDYVFAPGYKLKSLPEVEQYIQQHNHLPGIPSATEVVKQGIDVAKMDAKLLAKIEELTLYSIQLEKELRATKQHQQAEIDQLKQLVNQLLEKK